MKQALSPRATMAILAVVAVIIVIAGFAYFKPSFGPGPAVVPIPYKKPGSSGYGPGGAARTGTVGGPVPIGAPSTGN